MSDVFVREGVYIVNGDCLEELRLMPDASVDAVVTDPPAGIRFLQLGFDNPSTYSCRAENENDVGGETDRDRFVAWLIVVMRECLRVLKPGGHAFVWALPRTAHWTATAIEDAGFEIRDSISHVFGSGFPKSLNVSKAFDIARGRNSNGERETNNTLGGGVLQNRCSVCGKPYFSANPCICPKPEPVTDLAKQWGRLGNFVETCT